MSAKQSVLLATPSLDGTLSCHHVAALLGSIDALRSAGIGWEVTYEIGNSLIADARNQLLGRFHASTHSDLVFIDADIAWQPKDLLKLLGHDVPLVAGVYQRKSREKLDFTVKFPPQIRQHSGLLEAERTGAGFMRIRRDCLERMISDYPELRLHNTDKPDTYALFDTTIVDGVFLGEDYSFCDRWRAIGGKVLVDPDIRLSHYGTWAFDEPITKYLKQET
jgi:hypothetical protein